jgi:hypothetical protein
LLLLSLLPLHPPSLSLSSHPPRLPPREMLQMPPLRVLLLRSSPLLSLLSPLHLL